MLLGAKSTDFGLYPFTIKMGKMATHSIFLPGKSHGLRNLTAIIHGVAMGRTQPKPSSHATTISIINHGYECDYLLKPVDPSGESSNKGGLWGP